MLGSGLMLVFRILKRSKVAREMRYVYFRHAYLLFVVRTSIPNDCLILNKHACAFYSVRQNFCLSRVVVLVCTNPQVLMLSNIPPEERIFSQMGSTSDLLELFVLSSCRFSNCNRRFKLFKLGKGRHNFSALAAELLCSTLQSLKYASICLLHAS